VEVVLTFLVSLKIRITSSWQWISIREFQSPCCPGNV